jgi:dephospho-CoA kinase
LILEKNKKSEFDSCVVVTTDETVRLERILKNRNLSEEEIQKMMAAQLPDAEKVKQADYVIENSGDLEFLEAEVKQMIQFLHAHFI